MSQSEKLVYVASKDNNKNYVETVNMTVGQITFTQDKQEALAFNEHNANLIMQSLTNMLGNAHSEDDDR